MKHKHKWVNTTKLITKKGEFLNLFTKWYVANIAKCKCGEWYFITIRTAISTISYR